VSNCVAKDLAYGLVSAFRNIACTTSLNGKHEFPNDGSAYNINEFMAERRDDIRFQTPQDVIGMSRRIADSPPLLPSVRHSLKAVFVFTVSHLGFPLFGFGFGLAFGHRVRTSSQYLATGNVTLARLGKTDERIFAKGHHLLFAIEAITPAPQL
jgi:hypothetical protein